MPTPDVSPNYEILFDGKDHAEEVRKLVRKWAKLLPNGSYKQRSALATLYENQEQFLVAKSKE